MLRLACCRLTRVSVKTKHVCLLLPHAQSPRLPQQTTHLAALQQACRRLRESSSALEVCCAHCLMGAPAKRTLLLSAILTDKGRQGLTLLHQSTQWLCLLPALRFAAGAARPFVQCQSPNYGNHSCRGWIEQLKLEACDSETMGLGFHERHGLLRRQWKKLQARREGAAPGLAPRLEGDHCTKASEMLAEPQAHRLVAFAGAARCAAGSEASSCSPAFLCRLCLFAVLAMFSSAAPVRDPPEKHGASFPRS